ncbi:uncharacterized protein LOC143835961 isoform X4 [Paroedura picta]|uniref:uncharacterized protein LOC143835961 isoform X4 n=1 Tax=Paroedura picta TaxID=143630 RepID=UPI0040561EDC
MHQMVMARKMKRHFSHPHGMYHGRKAEPWFPGDNMPQTNNWAGRPFPPWSQEYQDLCWSQDYQDPQWGQGPDDPQWNPPNPQGNYPNQWWDQDHMNSQCDPVPQQDQYHPVWPSSGYGFHKGSFQPRASSFYRRRSHGRFFGKRSSSFYKVPKGKDSAQNSSRVLIEMKQNKKENDSEMKKDESVMEAQEDSVVSVKNSDLPQENKKGNYSEMKKDEPAMAKEKKQAQDLSITSVKNKVQPQQSKKENDSEMKKFESAKPKETKQAQEDSVILLKNTDPPQQSKKENDSEMKKDKSAKPKKIKQAQEHSIASVKNTDPAQQRQTENDSETKKNRTAKPKETKQAQEHSITSVKNTDPPQKKENDSEMKKDESAKTKETKQDQEHSVASVKNTDPPQQSKKENDSEMKKDKSAKPKKIKQAQEHSIASVKNTDPAQKSKKENDSEMKKDESVKPKETKQAQEDSVILLKNTDPPQVSQEASKAIISPSKFNFCLLSDSLARPVCSTAKTEDTELVSQEASKTIISPSQFSFRLFPDSLTCPLCSPAKTENTELDKQKGTETAEAQPNQAASLPSVKAPVEGQTPSNPAGSFHPVVKEEPPLATEAHCILVASLVSAEAPTGKQAPPETMKDSHPVVKEELSKKDTEAHSYQAASRASDGAPIGKQEPSKVTESVHPKIKEEPVLVLETKQDMNTASLTDPPSPTELSVPSCVVEPPTPLEIRKALLSLGKDEDELLESSQPTDHFYHSNSSPALEISLLSDTTDECKSMGKEDLELTQVGGSHEDTDCYHACKVLAGGSSALPVIPTEVHSVPVLVSGEKSEQPSFWESESCLLAPDFNWNDGGKGWAPEDCQEPSWAVDKAKKCGCVSELERNVVLSHFSFHSCCSSHQNPYTGRVLECCPSSSKSHHNSDSKHSSTQRTIKCSKSPLRRREITRIVYCSKCHCKCCQNPFQEWFQETEHPHTYSTHKICHYHPSKGTSKSCKMSQSYSPENPMMKSEKRKTKSTQRGATKKRSTSVKQRKSSKVTMNGVKVQAPVNHDAALGVETSIPEETTEHLQSANSEVHESVQLTPSSEGTGLPHQSCAGMETGTSTPPKIVEDPRSAAVLTRRNQIEQDYLQVILNFAVVATMLLQKEPCMEQELEVALRANMRSIGDHYQSMLRSFIDNYDLSETC